METEEDCYQKAKHACKYVTSHNEVSNFVVKGLGVGHSSGKDWVGGPDDQMASHRAVKKHAYKELVVVKSNTVSYPGTVVIHF